MGFPVVLKPINGSGGFRIRLARSQKEEKRNFEEVGSETREAWIQKYIRGVDASSSVLGNGRTCARISVEKLFFSFFV